MDTRRLLIVEDHEPTRSVLRALFVRKGWEVVAVGTVADGIANLDPPPAFIILDLDLPDGRGEAVLRRVREERLPTRVAICTATADYDRWISVARLHPEVQLQKPIRLDELCQAACEAVMP